MPDRVPTIDRSTLLAAAATALDIAIVVRYSCHACGIEKAEVVVRCRDADEDVVHWVEQVMGRALAADHRRRSPSCSSGFAQDVMIPIDGAEFIGGPAVQ